MAKNMLAVHAAIQLLVSEKEEGWTSAAQTILDIGTVLPNTGVLVTEGLEGSLPKPPTEASLTSGKYAIIHRRNQCFVDVIERSCESDPASYRVYYDARTKAPLTLARESRRTFTLWWLSPAAVYQAIKGRVGLLLKYGWYVAIYTRIEITATSEVVVVHTVRSDLKRGERIQD